MKIISSLNFTVLLRTDISEAGFTTAEVFVFFFFLVFFYVDYSHVRSVQPFLEFYQKYCRLFSFESLKLTDQEETFCFYLILSGVSFNSRRPLNASFCSTVALHICAEQRHLDQKPFSKHRRF